MEMALADLPDELHVHIFSFLAVADLCRCVEMVCRQWRRLAAEGSLWRALMLADCRSLGRVRQSIAGRAASAEARNSDHMLLFHHTSPHLLPSSLRPASASALPPTSASADDADLASDVHYRHSGSWKRWYRRLRAEEDNWATGRYRTSDETALATRRPHHPEGCEYLDVSGRYVVSGGWGLGLKIYDLELQGRRGLEAPDGVPGGEGSDGGGDDSESLPYFLEPVRQISNAHEDGVLSIRIVDDQFLSCSGESISLWDLESGAHRKTLRVDGSRFVFADIDKRSRFIAAGTEQGHLVVWTKSDDDAEGAKSLSWRREEEDVEHRLMVEEDLFSSHSSPPPLDLAAASPRDPVDLAFPPSFFTTSPSSFISSRSRSTSAEFASVSPVPTSPPPRWRKLQLLHAHTKRTRVVHFPKWCDGELLVSASYDGMIALWHTDLLSPPRRPTAVAHEAYRVADVAISDSSETQCAPRAFYHASDVVCVSTSEWDPHMLYSGGFDCTVKLWDMRLAASPAARTKSAPPSSAVAAYDWKALTRRQAAYNMAHKRSESNMGFYISTLDCDDWKLIAGLGHQIWIWDRRKLDQCMYVMDVCPPAEEVWCARAWGPNLVTGSRDGYVRLFDFSPLI